MGTESLLQFPNFWNSFKLAIYLVLDLTAISPWESYNENMLLKGKRYKEEKGDSEKQCKTCISFIYVCKETCAIFQSLWRNSSAVRKSVESWQTCICMHLSLVPLVPHCVYRQSGVLGIAKKSFLHNKILLWVIFLESTELRRNVFQAIPLTRQITYKVPCE